jgi:ABC-type dipeptide/oligopeptide/nickel transport system permease component
VRLIGQTRFIGQTLATFWLAATLAFFALRVLPGDAIQTELLGSGASAETIAERRTALGLDDPVVVQYGRFLTRILRGDLGVSLLDGRPVSEIIAQQLAPTVALAFTALIVATFGGVALGIVAALYTPLSGIARIILDLSLSMPLYWTGTLAIYIFAVQLNWLPTSGANNLTLPALVLGYHTAGAIGHVVRANVRDTLALDFVRTARSKGLRETQVIVRHVLRAALLPTVTVITLQAGFLLGGVVITESLFVRPGVGRLLLNATLRQDYPVVQGIVIVGAFVYVMLNAAADLLYRLLDPRV